ncbi:MAG: hypothetical protein HUU37_05710, partial [Bdellovibrionales bacterium]|nr:hypothetical protein [Bdellovibrionales bacterium]
MRSWLVMVALLAWGAGAPLAQAGSEDRKLRQETPPPAEEPPPPPAEPDDSPNPALEETKKETETPRPHVSPPPPAKKRPPMGSTDPDENVNWQQTVGWVKRGGLPDIVAPPALGVRGYRSNLVAMGVGDRTPGYGVLAEYSWNRLGFGLAASYKSLSRDRRADSYGFWSAYLNYR